MDIETTESIFDLFVRYLESINMKTENLKTLFNKDKSLNEDEQEFRREMARIFLKTLFNDRIYVEIGLFCGEEFLSDFQRGGMIEHYRNQAEKILEEHCGNESSCSFENASALVTAYEVLVQKLSNEFERVN